MEMEDENDLLLEDERLIREENIPGLTISGRNHETEILHKLHEQLGNFGTNNEEHNTDKQIENNNETALEEETEIEKKIRLGEMTPFGTAINKDTEILNHPNVQDYLLRQQKRIENSNKNMKTSMVQITHKNKFKKKKRVHTDFLGTETIGADEYRSTKTKVEPLLSEKITIDFENSSGSEYIPSDEETEEYDSDSSHDKPRKKSICRRTNKNNSKNLNSDSDTTKSKRIKINKVIDDGNEVTYEKRLKEYEKLCHQDDMLFHEIEDCSYFNIPLEVWSKLYTYQKVGVQWLWELHQQGAGCILADEMGLGKTIQIIAFLSGLYHSKLKNKHTGIRGLGPCIIVCPTTLMYQWVKEFHIWLPPVRVAVLHACGSFAGQKDKLIKDIQRGKGILITSYVGMLNHSEKILQYGWNYVILDEGHKIRNPNSKITLAVKQMKTPHRIILSGSPLQNNLEELWSLFDFIYPGKLGSLPMFQNQFSIPITHGGYANASDTEVMIAHKCATALKEIISPYLLRRSKIDVKSHINLPNKNEQVLFCQLTDCQRELYRTYLDSKQVIDIFEHRAHIFVGIINLRKICNHPDLFAGKSNTHGETISEEDKYGYWNKSGKMIVLETLLKIWRKQNHKVLVFTQSRKMLDILEQFIRICNYNYMKLDGGTYIGSRQPLIDQFNNDPNCFVMLLTTKVGGLGVNLTGANRIVIFDPDWNPATDTQARERAWRIGQTQDVTIYRLISVGTIEEKMYHRQIFKQFLTNKVLKDPKQRRFFKSNDLFELFTLKETNEGSTETGAIFAGTGTEINEETLKMKEKLRKKNAAAERKKNVELTPLPPIQFSQKKIEDMKLLAQRLSQKLVQKSSKNCSSNESSLKDKDKTENVVPSCSRNLTQAPMLKSHLNSQCSNNDVNSANLKKKKKRLFEGVHKVPYLMKSKKAKIQIESDEDIKTEKDEYVLKKLFSKTGMCSALQHDAIMDGGPPDYVIIEKEAERIAQKAIEELKRSESECFPASTGIPNWTGKNGIRGRAKTNVGVSSSSKILEKIRQRTGETEATSSEVRLLKDLKKFITSRGGISTTDKIIEAFQKDVPPNATPLFKSLLNKICNFHRGEDRKGYWTLKEE